MPAVHSEDSTARLKVAQQLFGKTVFAENCAGCHGEDGLGGPAGPDLTTMPLAQTEEGTIEQVTNGGGGMPAFGEQLSEEEISNVAAFVVRDVVGK